MWLSHPPVVSERKGDGDEKARLSEGTPQTPAEGVDAAIQHAEVQKTPHGAHAVTQGGLLQTQSPQAWKSRGQDHIGV